jgi:hypothetical protein
MKRPASVALIVATALCMAVPALAARDLIQIMRSDIRAEKTAIVTQVMHLTDEQGQLFWPVYKEYENEMIKLNDERLALIKDYTSSYNSMTDQTAKKLIDRSFKLQEARTRTLKKYVSKVSKTVDPKTAARWAQLEHALGAAIDLQLAAKLPLLK